MQRLKKRIPEAKVKVSLPDEFIMIPMDAMLIEQVLINLMENAFYHAHSDRGMELYTSADERFVTFCVKDYGTGISPERLETVFDGEASTGNGEADSYRGWASACPSARRSLRRTGARSRRIIMKRGRKSFLHCPGNEEECRQKRRY